MRGYTIVRKYKSVQINFDQIIRVFQYMYIFQILACCANVRDPAKSPVFVIADQRVLNLIIERGMI